MIHIDPNLKAVDLLPKINDCLSLAAKKVLNIESSMGKSETPVFTVQGQYQPQDWTEWTQGFQFGSALLVFDATRDEQFLEIGRKNTLDRMASHVTHFGVHDHGFNNISTYGCLRRLAREKRFEANSHEQAFFEMALKASSAVQAARWSTTAAGPGYIYSFNGPHSLFCDTIRSLRSLAIGHQLNHQPMFDNDVRVSLLDRLIQHARCTAMFNVYYGEGRDHYDVSGRVAHESIFNRNDGQYRCPSTQQGYSPFSTWTRGLSWVMLGYPEQLEFLATVSDDELAEFGGRDEIEPFMLRAAKAACEFYLENTPTCGIPYWDTGAPGLLQMGDYLEQPADPLNDWEPVDSSAAAIGCQGLLRLGRYLIKRGDRAGGERFWQAGLTTLRSLLREPYLSTNDNHQGLLLHTVYHRPRNWDYVPDGSKIPYGESCLWGDYHLLEAALYIHRIAQEERYYTFFG